MRKFYVIIVSIAALFLVLSCGGSKVKEIWSTPGELKVPESVMYDSTNNVLYVSNINGKSTDMDGNGFISKISPDGKIIKLQWVTGMSAPKGMGIFKNTLYVTDIDRIHVIDIAKSKIIKTVIVKGAKFLNDIAIDKSGNVYITDMAMNRVLILSGGAAAVWLDLKEYNKPNGLFMEGDSLMVGTAKGLLRVNIKTKSAKMEVPLEGGIDGLKSDGKGSYIVSDWKGKIQLIGKETKPVVLNDTSDKKINAADIEYIPEKKMILVPTFFDNRVVAYKLNQ